MRIAYMTTDEVNADLAQCWGNTYDCEVIPVSPNDPCPDCGFDAAIYDLDFLPLRERQQMLMDFVSRPLLIPTAMHSYNLPRRDVQGLCARGVLVHRKLERGILGSLRGEVRRLNIETRPMPERQAVERK